ncbi:DUF2326 domain-containing protein [Legionella pneumophila serogroup 1]
MYLDKLIVRTPLDIIREIDFKFGLNLIIDESSSASKDSGNNVGKTTFLRVIDYCLGGKIENIYKDKEFKRENKIVRDFLKTNVEFELRLTNRNGISHSIIRSMDNKSIIDGNEFTGEKFKEALFSLLFNYNGKKPSLGQLMNKFVRIDEEQISNALYFLHKATDFTTYESLFLFLFGFRNSELLLKKRQVIDQIKKIKSSISNSDYSIEDLDQQIHLIKKEIDSLQELKSSFNFIQEVDNELESLKNLQTEISENKTLVSTSSLKYEMNVESLKQLKESKANLDVKYISSIYKQAQINIPNLETEFNEVLSFHNEMLDNKIKYLEGILKSIEKQLTEYKQKLKILLNEESKLVQIMSQKGVLGEYDKINVKLQDMFKEVGFKEALLINQTKLNDSLLTANHELKKINNAIGDFSENLKQNLKLFNEYFSTYSQMLYGNKYYLSTKHGENDYSDHLLLDIGNLNENMGTGMKKAQISALDLAYLKYSEISKFDLPQFVLHDQLETVFENQIGTLFELANSMKGQFVVAVLSDKLKNIDPNTINENCILRLSQSDKFFKIP